jgi:Uma2 family endonuclease
MIRLSVPPKLTGFVEQSKSFWVSGSAIALRGIADMNGFAWYNHWRSSKSSYVVCGSESASMSTVAAKRHYTPEDLLAMPNGDRFELVDGQLVERNMSAWSSHIGGRMVRLLGNFCEENPLGWTMQADCSYQCFPHAPSLVRKPDVSVIRFGRFPNERLPEGHIRIAPDLAVEVLSPNDLDYETDQKIEEYLRAGVRLVWVINPESRTVLIYRADGSINGLREQDELSGEDVLPGFRCRVAELFRLPTPAIQPGNSNG